MIALDRTRLMANSLFLIFAKFTPEFFSFAKAGRECLLCAGLSLVSINTIQFKDTNGLRFTYSVFNQAFLRHFEPKLEILS